MGREGDHGLWSLEWRRLVSLLTLTATNMPEMMLASMSQVVRHDGACFLTESHTEDAGSKVALGDGVYGRGIRRAKLAYAWFSQCIARGHGFVGGVSLGAAVEDSAALAAAVATRRKRFSTALRSAS